MYLTPLFNAPGRNPGREEEPFAAGANTPSGGRNAFAATKSVSVRIALFVVIVDLPGRNYNVSFYPIALSIPRELQKESNESPLQFT
jgi:hypothetical protein